ncbi:hypothetical protein EV174_005078, partial [Coemansia sp. RSA 2320]
SATAAVQQQMYMDAAVAAAAAAAAATCSPAMAQLAATTAGSTPMTDLGSSSSLAGLDWSQSLGGVSSGAKDEGARGRRRCTVPQSRRSEPSSAGGSQQPQPQPQQPFFGGFRQHQAVYSLDRRERFGVRVEPQVDRGFFVAGGSEWTCYRRNYFQVSCGVTVGSGGGGGGGGRVVVVDAGGSGAARTASGFLVAISAQVASGGSSLPDSAAVQLVQHTPKRDKGPQTTPQPRAVGVGGGAVSFERLQFKTATANNGKRRAAQQYYVLAVELLADCDDGSRCLVASAESAPIVVRGRSPGHYADSGSTPAAGAAATAPVAEYIAPNGSAGPYPPPFALGAPPFQMHAPALHIHTPTLPSLYSSQAAAAAKQQHAFMLQQQQQQQLQQQQQQGLPPRPATPATCASDSATLV